ncbi:MAG: hypothetical protein JWQ04_1617, partial [Pedosphaera sp.]|nr:hypothetical protein [Pedosphaera sp.]
MLSKILLGLAAVIIIFLIIVALQPAQYSVTRSVSVAAPPEAVFPHVNELKKWEPWNPFAKLDPAIKMTYEGKPAGVGASYS